jgi:hypothetical protein
MPGSRKSIDDDDNAVKLMPNVAKLIRADSDSLVCLVMLTVSLDFCSLTALHANLKILYTFNCPQESNGSTSMSLCGISGKDKVETQSAKPSRQRRAEAGLRDVANKFLRRGATGKRSIGACKPSTLDMLSSYHRCIMLALNPLASLIPLYCWLQLIEKASLSFDCRLFVISKSARLLTTHAISLSNIEWYMVHLKIFWFVIDHCMYLGSNKLVLK